MLPTGYVSTVLHDVCNIIDWFPQSKTPILGRNPIIYGTKERKEQEIENIYQIKYYNKKVEL